MSTTTPNLTLTLYDSTTDQVVTFATFRAVWGGTATTSNFYRIDTWAGTVNSSISTLQNQRGAIPVSASYVSANYYESTVSSITSYTTGMTILLKLDTDSAGTVTLNISSLGTKSVTKVNSSGTIVNISAGELQSNRYYLFTYDGTQWVWVNAQSSDQIVVVGGTSGNVLTVASDGSINGTTTQATLIAQTIHDATLKSPMVDGDEIGIADSNASYAIKKGTVGGLKNIINTNYAISTSVASNNLTVALKLTDGSTDPSSSSPINFKVGTSILSVTSSLSVTVPASAGDVFGFDSRKIQDQDCQLFVYIINNNGTAQLGVSPNPTLATIVSPYYDSGGQTGSAGQNNIVMSGTRNATNTSSVIGLITAKQSDSNNWQTPTLNFVANYPTYETTWLKYIPSSYTGFSSSPTSAIYYKITKDTCHIKTGGMGVGTSNATSFSFSSPFTSSNLIPERFPILTFDNGATWNGGWGVISANSSTITIYKATYGTDNFTASGNKGAYGSFSYLVFM